MARPELNWITFEIDGKEVRAPEGAMLVDAAKHGDVEIPYFCYEPKLGQPVGACRMCLVEIEGIPKLQTSCSTPVRDGMVVNTTSDRVKHAQNAIVEFLLVNHPLDCPVCDKGGECPLQDISFGWGAGRSRFIEPKRHFKKPLELSPLVAIDRERCILCYRCVRFSQEVAEDYQLVFLERGDHTFVGTHDGRPYVGPVQRQHHRALPRRRAHLAGLPLPRAPVGHRGLGLGLHDVPVPVQRRADAARRRQGRARARARQRGGRRRLALRQGPLRVPVVSLPGARHGTHGARRRLPAAVLWERALSEAAAALKKSGERAVALVGGRATNEEGFLVQHLMREGLGSAHVDSRAAGRISGAHARALARPELSAKVSDIDHAGAILVLDTELVDEAPILDLRVRKAVRRNGARLVVASSRPSTLDPNAAASLRFAPGGAEAALAALAAASGSARASDASLDDLARAARASEGFRAGAANGHAPRSAADAVQAAAEVLRDAGDIVVIWGERVAAGERGEQAIEALLALSGSLGVADREESGLIEIPAGTNGRGLREVGCLPNLGPGFADASAEGMTAAEALGSGELGALLLVEHELPAAVLEEAGTVIAFAGFLDEGLEEHADIVFPAETYAEKEGTVTHPDGRLQRVRQALGHAARGARRLERDRRAVRANRSRHRSTHRAHGHGHAHRGGAVLRRHNARGDRRPRGSLAGARRRRRRCRPATCPTRRWWTRRRRPGAARHGRAVALERARDRALPLTSLPLHGARAELSVEDARQAGVANGDEIRLLAGGSACSATVVVRTGVAAGSVFLSGADLPDGEVRIEPARPTVEAVAAGEVHA